MTTRRRPVTPLRAHAMPRGGLLACFFACVAPLAAQATDASTAQSPVPKPLPGGHYLARLGGGDAATAAAQFEKIRAAFAATNSGYDLRWAPKFERESVPDGQSRAIFVQSRTEDAAIKIGDRRSRVSVGDIVIVRGGETATAEGAVGALVFTVPTTLETEAAPSFVRPDEDPKITDEPGGCAEETGAYRRILLTWQKHNGPYNWQALNAHRVRIMDSFTHYHPVEGGFDEFYLVQMVQPGARILTSARAADLEAGKINKGDVDSLFASTELAVGDLVYLPRGVIHRGLGGVLAQVITVPGFRPGAELAVDHLLAALNQRLELEGGKALPVHRSPVSDLRPDGITFEKLADRVRVSIDEEPFTELRHEGLPLPVLHPVYGPGGVPLTRGYPLDPRPGESHDHPHHRGVWFAHGSINGIDFWHDQAERAGRVDVGLVETDAESGTIRCTQLWLGPEGETVLSERRTLRFGRVGAHRAIDFEIRLRAPADSDVTFGDTKEGTMAVRLCAELRVKGDVARGTLTNSRGQRDDAVWGHPAHWVDASGKVGEAHAGVALFDHPDNHRHPTWWHARTYGLLAANPFGAHDFAKQRRGVGAFTIKKGEEQVFRYRLVLHAGDVVDAGIDSLWRRYAAPR